jgi:uncharacterized RDD family membrane protein YckC
MRCPKCHYISFDSNDRCRNCGYEFSLSVDVKTLDLPIQTGDEAIGPLRDFPLTDVDPRVPPAPARSSLHAPGSHVPANVAPPPRPITSSFDLPLFKDRALDDDRPLVTPPVVPRVPLSVRRSSPVIPRSVARASIEEPVLDLDGANDEDRIPASAVQAVSPQAPAGAQQPGTSASPIPRLLAGLLDLVILGLLAAIVLYFTLKVCGFELAEAGLLPPVPLAGFLLLLAGGYFILFTAAGGQTIGKMAAGIKVVPLEGEGQRRDRVPLGHAVLRAVGYLVSILPGGLGFLPALFGADRRAVHDRLADTRVVKA